ncbi:manganese-dependent inorganic pyrophosphatase, partial [Sulfurimonas sp.]|uniref:manganese-dependent inorganic pyrophosphatase n=1 Tax=Sulfurimonas sp. TaxID=2022749 RepID=UPI0025E250C1
PARQGDISPETEFILKKFKAETPQLKTSYAGESVYLVDFSDLAQAPKDIKEATILGIVDHHKLGDITTDAPLECWIRPIGCSNTVIKEMYDYHKVEIPKDIAGMMMCAILSDTVIFKSPTCTKIDTKVVKELSVICGIDDYKALAMEMFIAKSAIDGASARNLNTRDYKEFDMNGTKVGIGQLEMVDISALNNRINDLFSDMKLMKQESELHTIIILLTDIMKEGSQLLVLSDDASRVEKALNTKLQDNQAWLDGVLSRKKQIIPFLQKQF